MNTQAAQVQELAAAYARGRQEGSQSMLARVEAEIRYAWEEGHKAARERAYRLMALASAVAFAAGAWFF